MDNTALPNVFVNPEVSAEKAGKKLRFNPKWIFIILGLVVVIELIVGIRSLTLNNPQPSSPPASNAPAVVSAKGVISLKTSQQKIMVGDSFPVTIEVNAPLSSVGVDIIARFDPKVLQASDSSIQKGTIYPEFPVAKIEEGNMIRISGIVTPGSKGFSGKGVLATITFKAISKGTTDITLEHKLGSTADTNIVSETSAKDLLEEVHNLEVTVR